LLQFLPKVLVTARGESSTGLQLPGCRLGEGRHFDDQLTQRLGRKRREVLLHCGPAGVGGRRSGRVEDGEANGDEVLAEVAGRGVGTAALAVYPVAAPTEVDHIDVRALHGCRGSPALDTKPSD
jgi:hypothetical protein